MDAKHTPTPWHDSGLSDTLPGGFIEARNGKNICLYYAGPETAVGDQGKANAAFIVRACNAHEELVAALRGARSDLTWVLSGDKPFGNEPEQRALHNIVDSINAALAKAEGK